MEELKELRKLINKARNLEIKKDSIISQIFDILRQLDVNISIETNAENADDLEQAINCYIGYGEYGINSIIKEIKGQIKSN